MPTITFSLTDLSRLTRRKITKDQLDNLIRFCKGELEDYDSFKDEATVSLSDTNLPYLWSVEGIARLLRGVLGVEKSIPEIKIEKGDYRINVDKSVNKIRPYITAFVAKGQKVDDYLLKQIVQLQEKLCDNFGRRRKKVAIGIYPHDKISFPLSYRATDPESIEFLPLDVSRKMNQKEILEDHPKGKEYAHILEGFKKYPILLDSKSEVLSFPPIINSAITGKVEIGDENIFFEATGNDMESLHLVTNIFAYALYERGFQIYSVNIKYGPKIIHTPHLFKDSIKLKADHIQSLLDLDLKVSEIKSLLEKARYKFDKFKVQIPPYRKDIMHQVDVIEDIGIMYGYDKINPLEVDIFTVGKKREMTEFKDDIRELTLGLGHQEIFSPILTNGYDLHERMNVKDLGTIEIKNFMSETYSVVRSWLIPTLMDVLSKNKHVDYPQKIFEQGLVSVKKGNKVVEYERIALASTHQNADFTEMKKALDFILRSLGVKYETEETEHNSFIPGRVARVSVDGKGIAYIGEIHPEVLFKWRLEMPVAALELNLSDLFEIMGKNKGK